MMQAMTDDDEYKFKTQQAYLLLFPYATGTFEFIDRNKTKVSSKCIGKIRERVEAMSDLRLVQQEKDFMAKKGIYTPAYLEYLVNYRFNPDEIKIEHIDGRLKISAAGLLHRITRWEIPSLFNTSESYFDTDDLKWDVNLSNYVEATLNKAKILGDAGCNYREFGTRRRRNFRVQDLVVKTLKGQRGFMGTSNVFLAMLHGVSSAASTPHEWTMATSALSSLNHANLFACEQWAKLYKGDIALTDTFGSEAFYNDLTVELARIYRGFRQDSNCPFKWTDLTVESLKKIDIDPMTKFAIYSDSLHPKLCVDIHEYCKSKINDGYGIGTNFTNDFPNSPALNIVMKLTSVNGKPVVKLGDGLGKASGDPNMVKVAQYLYRGIPLN